MVRVYTDYTPVRILYNIDGGFEDNAAKAGLVGNFVSVEESDLPQNRDYRDSWVYLDGKVIEDPIVKKAIWESRIEKHNQTSKVLEKLGITMDEFKLLLGA